MNKSESKYFNTAVKFNKALLSLLDKKPFAYITIRELCQEAGVNRSTFYLHYENTQDLLQETIAYVLHDFTSHFPMKESDLSCDLATRDVNQLNFITEEYLYPYLSYIRDNRHVFITFLSQPLTFGHDDLFHNLSDHIFEPILDRFHYPQAQRDYVMRFYLNGITAVIVQWLRNDCCENIPEVIAILQTCIFGQSDVLKSPVLHR